MSINIQTFSPRVLPLNYNSVQERDGCEILPSGNTFFSILPFEEMCVFQCTACDTTGIFNQPDKLSYALGPRANGDQPWWMIAKKATVISAPAGNVFTLSFRTDPNDANNVMPVYTFAIGYTVYIHGVYYRITAVGGTVNNPTITVSPAISGGESAAITAIINNFATSFSVEVQVVSAPGFIQTATSASTTIALTSLSDLANFTAGDLIYIAGSEYTIASVGATVLNLTTPLRRTYAQYTALQILDPTPLHPMDKLWVAWRAVTGIRYGMIDETGDIEINVPAEGPDGEQTDFGPSNVGQFTHLGLTISYNLFGLWQYDTFLSTDIHASKVSLAFTDWGTVAVAIRDTGVEILEVSYRLADGTLYSQDWAGDKGVLFNYNLINHDVPANGGLVCYYLSQDGTNRDTIYARFQIEDWDTEHVVVTGLRIELETLITMVVDPDSNRTRAILYAKTTDGRCVTFKTPSYAINVSDTVNSEVGILSGDYVEGAYTLSIEESGSLALAMSDGIYGTAASQAVEKVTGGYAWVGTNVQRLTGVRDFTTEDVGKTILFVVTGQFTKITALVDVANVTVADSPVGSPTGAIILYGLFGDPGRINMVIDMPVIVYLGEGAGTGTTPIPIPPGGFIIR